MSRSDQTGSSRGKRKLSRRQCLRLLGASGLTASVSLMAACSAAPSPAPTTAPAAPKAAPAALTAAPPAPTAAPAGIATASSAATAPAAAQMTPKKGGTIVHASGYEADTLDPTRTTNGQSALIITNLMDGLVNFGRESVDPEPALAKSWDISSDGKQYTFHLREGVKFHDGTPCDAAAVKFNFDRIIDPKNPYHRDDMEFAKESLLGPLERVEAPDPLVVRLFLKEPFAPFMVVLACQWIRFGSPKAIQTDPDGFGSHPVGNGPFKFSNWTRKANVELVRNDDYWDQKAYLDKIVFKYVPESSVRLSEVETGSTHLFDSIGVRDIDRIKANPQLELATTPYPAFLFAWLNVQLPPTDNKKLRQAICYAVNSEAIVKNLFNGIGVVADCGPLAPGMLGYKAGLSPYKYDPDKAKALLAEAGFSSGTKLSMLSYNYQRAYNPAGGDKVSQAMQADLKKVGLEVDLQVLDSAPYNAARKDPAKRPNIILGGWFDDYVDPDQFMFAHAESTQPRNYGGWKNAEFDKLAREARSVSDEAKRAELYQQAAKVYLEEAPHLMISYGLATAVLRKTVQNAHLTPLMMWRFDRVWLSPSFRN